MRRTRLAFIAALLLGCASIAYAQWRQAVGMALNIAAVQPAAGAGLYAKTVTLSGGADTFETTSTVLDFVLAVDPNAAGNVTVTIGSQTATLWPGFATAYRSADIASFSFSGTSGDKVTIMGQTPAVR